WITCEDTSPYLGCWGDAYATTPNLDRFAGRAIRYTNAFSTAPVCSPARSCLITGVYATSLGTQNLRSDIRIPKQIEPLPKRLRVAGYYCSNNFKEDYNFKDATMWDDSSPTAHWRRRPAGTPFFSVFNIMCTHQGQVNGSDEEFFQKYTSKLKPEERHDPKVLPLPPFYPDTPMVRKIWARYYDLITTMDKQVGDLLGQLETDGLAESTIVFFFPDHGLGLPRFKRTLYDTGLRVPLMIRVPGRYQHLAPYASGGQTDQLVSFVDFAPTVLSLAGLELPPHMQGQPFLGQSPAKPRQYIFATHSRVDEAYDMSRCVRDKRYKYIRNFLPHLPYIQPSDYCDQAEIMQELRRVAKEGGMAGIEKPLWGPTKPVEELYDTLTDPLEVKNLAGSPAQEQTLSRMRQQLRDWMAQTKDTELLPEAEMHIRSAGSTPYEMARDPRQYAQARILATAELVGEGPKILPALTDLLENEDSAVRYWAAVALEALGPEAAPAMGALKKVLNDPSPDVRITAARVLCRLGSCDNALPVLGQDLLDRREVVVLHAARTVELLGDKARPLALQMGFARERCKNLDGSYRNDNYAEFIDWALKHAQENCR
ncbi:MAG: sulfatase-like hydrolase/transferase, partial [Planctomycetes bacterium]|nr:sulfatase-like hydrolase/transferase [Planctomycetota bacterium]